MKTQQIEKEIEHMDEIVFSESSNTVQVGFTTDKNTLLQISKSVELLKENDATFTLDEEGISFRGMDHSHVALIDIGIPNTCFEKYSCIEKQKFGVNIIEFRKLVYSLDNKGSISLIIKKEEILISQNGFNAKIKLLEPSEKDCPLPHISYDDSMVIFSPEQNTNAIEFKKILAKINTISDHITINCDDSRIVFSGSGDSGNAEKTIDREECEINNKEDSETTYGLEFIMAFLKTLSKNSNVELGFSKERPLRLQTKINNLGRIDFYLAPRVEY
jgi:proliferating cell nuclear antigen